MSKHNYEIVLNNGCTSKQPVVYEFARTKNITIHMRRNNATLRFVQGGNIIDADAAFYGSNALCADGIKKILLLYLIRYDETLAVKHVTFVMDDIVISECDGSSLYSMANGPLKYPFPESWKSNDISLFITAFTKSAYDGRMNALISMVLSKTRDYRSERFLYLWMSLNGLYGFLTDRCKKMPDCKLEFRKESKQLELLCRVFDFGAYPVGRWSESQELDLYRKGLSLLKSVPLSAQELYDRIATEKSDPVSEMLHNFLEQEVLDIHIDTKTFMIVWLPYQIRCRYFHNNLAMPLFLFEGEGILNALHICNYFLDRFICEALREWMTDKEPSREQVEQIHKALLQIQPPLTTNGRG